MISRHYYTHPLDAVVVGELTMTQYLSDEAIFRFHFFFSTDNDENDDESE